MTTWHSYYISPEHALWQGRSDNPPASCFFQIVYMLDLLKTKPANPTHMTFGILGFSCDEGIRRNQGRIGAGEGPNAIRGALAELPIQKQNVECYDVGNIMCIDGNLEAAQAALGEVIALLFQHGIIPIIIGGGHELAWGHYQGIARSYPDKNLGIINFDSHFDLRSLSLNNEGHSGTSFLQIAEAHRLAKRRFDYNCVGVQHAANIRQLFDTAKKYKTHVIWADELHQGLVEKTVDFIDRVIDQNEIVYVSLCLDVFASPYAPGVSETQPLGLHPWHIIPLIRQLAASGKVISYDIAEMSPRYDIDQSTAKLAAAIIYELIHHHNQPKICFSRRS